MTVFLSQQVQKQVQKRAGEIIISKAPRFAAWLDRDGVLAIGLVQTIVPVCKNVSMGVL